MDYKKQCTFIWKTTKKSTKFKWNKSLSKIFTVLYCEKIKKICSVLKILVIKERRERVCVWKSERTKSALRILHKYQKNIVYEIKSVWAKCFFCFFLVQYTQIHSCDKNIK